MSKRAKQRALETYPKVGSDLTLWTSVFGIIEIDKNAIERKACQKGYELAEKDLTLTWKDIELLHQLLTEEEDNFAKHDKYFYAEVLHRFNESKEEK